MSHDAITLRSLWDQTAEALGVRHEARWICEVASALDGDEFMAELDAPVTQRVVGHLDAMVARYRAGEPLAYVLGRWSFRHLDLAVDERVLIPRPETEIVAGAAIESAVEIGRIRGGSVVVADLGAGSGAIGLSLATELPLDGTTVWLTDVDESAISLARANLAGIGRPARNVRIGVGSWFDALPAPDEVRFDVIVSNPPYVAVGSPDLADSVADWEPEIALLAGADGLDAYRTIVPGARDHLAVGGWLVLEIGADQGEVLRTMLTEHGYEAVEIRADLTGRDRIALGRLPR